MSAVDAETWIARCTRRLRALDPNSPLDGTDWDDIAGDLLEAVLRGGDSGSSAFRPWLSPEFAAETYLGTR